MIRSLACHKKLKDIEPNDLPKLDKSVMTTALDEIKGFLREKWGIENAQLAYIINKHQITPKIQLSFQVMKETTGALTSGWCINFGFDIQRIRPASIHKKCKVKRVDKEMYYAIH